MQVVALIFNYKYRATIADMIPDDQLFVAILFLSNSTICTSFYQSL